MRNASKRLSSHGNYVLTCPVGLCTGVREGALGMDLSIKRSVLIAAVAALWLAGCSQGVPPHMMPVPGAAKALLAKKGMRVDAPIFVRIFKQESELEVWKAKADGRFYHFKTYPICTWSGKLGPKFKQGDKQTPEGFYKVSARMMNPNSSYHLSFNIGYPNIFDKVHKRTGDFIMVHGDCRSAGCYAMTDVLIEEIYALAREAFAGGQKAFDLHAYPFRMTAANMQRHAGNRAAGFWRDLQTGYQAFEATRRPPRIDVCERRYLVNVSFKNGAPANPAAACPAFEKLPIEAIPRPPVLQQARTGLPRSDKLRRGTSRAASPATLGQGASFGAAPAKPSLSGFAFRTNSRLGQ